MGHDALWVLVYNSILIKIDAEAWKQQWNPKTIAWRRMHGDHDSASDGDLRPVFRSVNGAQELDTPSNICTLEDMKETMGCVEREQRPRRSAREKAYPPVPAVH